MFKDNYVHLGESYGIADMFIYCQKCEANKEREPTGHTNTLN